MKIFVVGMPNSGRTTVAKAIAKPENYMYIDSVSWVKNLFRPIRDDEKQQQYDDEYYQWLVNVMKNDPNIFVNVVNNAIGIGEYANKKTYVIDGVFSPIDFVKLFDYNQDIVVFLNRNSNTADYRDHENIGVPVMRDFCFWLSSANLIDKNRWLEYNFSIPGEDSSVIKKLGQKNSVFIVKSIDKVMAHLQEHLLSLQAPQS